MEWREPKVVILFETDEKGRMVRGSRPVIDGTLQGPDVLIELVAFHLHRLGAAKAKLEQFVATMEARQRLRRQLREESVD